MTNILKAANRRVNRSTSPTNIQPGFTIVELLIVIVVIGVLAAISIVAYNGIQARASMTKKETIISNVSKKLELYRIESNQYPNTYDNDTDTFSLDSLVDAGILNTDTDIEVDPQDYSGDGSYDKDKVYITTEYYNDTNSDSWFSHFLYYDNNESEWIRQTKATYYSKTGYGAGTYETSSYKDGQMHTSENGQPVYIAL